MRPAAADEADRGRSPAAVAALVAGAALVVLALVALGTWQLHRLSWKLDLIARVDARIHAPPVPPPGPALWPSVDAERDAYRHVTVRGRYLDGDETLVKAVTESGSGFWVLTPLLTDDGFTVLVNRGFVPDDRSDAASRAAGRIGGETVVTGLLRITEPGGGFLRSNDPAGDRWFSRDVAALAAARHLGPAAPYFIDADGTPNAGGLPVGGLTVVAFPNNHLVYAITWFGLAVLLSGAMVRVVRDEMRSRRGRALRRAA